MSTPIWKDAFFQVPGAGVRGNQYQIVIDGSVIHSGRVVNPNTGYAMVRWNQIVAPYLKQSFPGLVAGFLVQPELERAFTAQFKSGSTWANIEQKSFNYDWSYKDVSMVRKSDPIKALLDARQIVYWTTLPEGDLRATITKSGGQELVNFGTVAIAGTARIILSDYMVPEKVRIQGANTDFTFDIDNSGCHNYVLYYVNAFGGWDSLLVTGKTVQVDAYERKMFGRSYDNTTIEHGRENYQNKITRRWELHTDWLTDAEASRMHHLLGSTMVVLCDLSSDEYKPVVITNNDCIYKTFATNGHRMASYIINTEFAQDITRE